MRKRRRRRRLVQAVTLQEVRLERESQRWKWTAPRWLLPAGWTCRSRASRRRSAPDTTSGGQPSTVWYGSHGSNSIRWARLAHSGWRRDDQPMGWLSG